MSWWSDFSGFVRENEPMAKHTWLAMGGRSELYAEPPTVDDLARLVKAAGQAAVPIRILGGGSNILVRDEGVSGLVIHLTGEAFEQISITDQSVTAGAGAKLGHLVSQSTAAGLSGLETLVGIPGTVGGALRGNASAQGGDLGQCTQDATVMTDQGDIIKRPRSELVFSYGKSNLDELVILSGTFLLEPAAAEEISRRMQQIWIVKKKEQPMAHQSYARMFTDPRGMDAGELIDQAGLKGTRIGAAEISDRDANYMITDRGATSDDVLKLINLVRSRVLDRADIELELELEVW
ncbi:MAG: UDP-N-acetylmuramate dehydrogenase [Pirellulales bacterium]|nr:UDP-N-acetylmuramate dehydrogenase [Pirellulales bacterium]